MVGLPGGYLFFLGPHSLSGLGSKCNAYSPNRATLVCNLTPRNAPPFQLVACYRSDNSRSAVFESEFFQSLSEICVKSSELGQKTLVMGDFNAKIGDASSEVGLFKDFIFLCPEKSAKATLDLQGKFLLEAMSAGDFMLCPIEDVR